MATIEKVLKRKGRNVYSIKPDQPVLDGLRALAQHNIGALLVMDGDKLLGVFSERDFARRISERGALDIFSPISELMTDTKIWYAEPGHTVDECMKLMLSKHIRHLPVLQAGKVIGIVSINDLVREIITDRENEIKSLENFIAGQASAG